MTRTKMIPKLSVLGLLFTPASIFAQFAVRPDITFGENNDRFDLTSMIHDTNRMFSQQQEPQALDEEEESRRNLNNNEEDIIELVPDDDTSRKSARRFENDFAYHDRMDSNEGGTVVEYEQNLKHFMNDDNLKKFIRNRRMMNYVKYLHDGREPGRRSGSSRNEEDLLMHYAVPFVMDVDGYMKVPLH